MNIFPKVWRDICSWVNNSLGHFGNKVRHLIHFIVQVGSNSSSSLLLFRQLLGMSVSISGGSIFGRNGGIHRDLVLRHDWGQDWCASRAIGCVRLGQGDISTSIV